MNSNYLIVIFSCLILACYAENSNVTKRSVQTIAIIADGGTNSGTALANGKGICSSAGKIVECAGITMGSYTLKIGESGVSTSTTLVTKLLVQGTAGSGTSTGANAAFYGSADQYPMMEILGYNHNDVAILFDAYYSSGYKSSSSSGNFQIQKTASAFNIQYASGVAAGSAVTFATALGITPGGIVDVGSLDADSVQINTALLLPNVGGGTTVLDYYDTWDSCTMHILWTGVSENNLCVSATRIGRAVTLTFTAAIKTFTSATSIVIGDYTVAGNYLPQRFCPMAATRWPVMVDNGATGGSATGKIGWVEVAIGGSPPPYCYFSIYDYAAGSFTTGLARGFNKDIVISYNVDG